MITSKGIRQMNEALQKHLDISSVHIKEKDDTMLSTIASGARAETMLTAWQFDYGFWVVINPEVKTVPNVYRKHLTDAGFSDEFVDILVAAESIGCTYVLFDCDGTIYEDVPKFDW